MSAGKRGGPGGNKPNLERTRSICARFDAMVAAGERQADAISALAGEYGVLAPALRLQLRRGKAARYVTGMGKGGGRQKGPARPRVHCVAPRPSVSTVVRASDILAPAEPCPRCAVRADVGCKHRPAEGPQPLAIARAADKAKADGRAQPANYVRSFWGKGGNPTRSEFASYSRAFGEAIKQGSSQ